MRNISATGLQKGNIYKKWREFVMYVSQSIP